MSAEVTSRPRPRRRWIWVIVALLTAAACVLPAALGIWMKEDMQQEADRIVKSRRGITALQVTAPGDAVSISPGPPGEPASGPAPCASAIPVMPGKPGRGGAAGTGRHSTSRSCRVWSRRGPTPTAAIGAPIMSSRVRT
jgi:hypothetical protein